VRCQRSSRDLSRSMPMMGIRTFERSAGVMPGEAPVTGVLFTESVISSGPVTGCMLLDWNGFLTKISKLNL
jgi:hypothetical protein